MHISSYLYFWFLFCLLHTHTCTVTRMPQGRNEGSLWFLQYNLARTPGDNEVLVCLKLEQIISVGGGCLITKDQTFFFFFFLAVPQLKLGPWWQKNCAVWLVSRSSVNWNPFWSFRFAAALLVHCAAPAEWNDLTSASPHSCLPTLQQCSSLLSCTFAPEASSSKWARNNKAPACRHPSVHSATKRRDDRVVEPNCIFHTSYLMAV